MKPKWDNLLGNCCPRCGGDLLRRKPGFECSFSTCEFFIRAERLAELRASLRQQHFGERLANTRRHRQELATSSLLTA